MERGLVFHNAMQLTIPIWLVPLIFNSFPRVDLGALSFVAVLGMLFPDVDHFSMWRKVRHKGFFDFIRFCVHADRYRKAFLPFHNHIAIYAIAGIAVLTWFVNFYVSVFFIAFFVHLIFDYIADLFMIKRHTHWRLRNWFDADYSGLPIAQQVQQGHKQEHHSGKPRRRRKA